MPGSESGTLGEKRKQSEEHPQRKRIGVDSPSGRIATIPSISGSHGEEYWMVQWRMHQYKKHKTWEGDAVLVLHGSKGTLYDLEGKLIGRKDWVDGEPESGHRFHVGNKEVELDQPIQTSQVPSITGVEVEGDEASAEEVVDNSPFSVPILAPSFSSRKENVPQSVVSQQSPQGFIPPTSFYGQRLVKKPSGSLHDPDAEGAVVMKTPTKEHSDKYNKKRLQIVPVVLDPMITITLVWTLLKQNPYGGGSVIGKALINWRAEFRKWLGRDRLGVFTGEKNKSSIKQFVNSKIHQVLVIGYEKLRNVMIILSGTPIQNDLSEFHAMANFCNPGLLDDYSTFRRVYEVPILKSRAPDCTPKELELGEARSVQLTAIAKSFVLRREATILKNYLPPKYEYIVFITPTQLQTSMLAAILSPEKLDTLIEGPTAESLALINMLTKISNSPVLLKAQVDKMRSSKSGLIIRPGVTEALKLLPEKTRIEDFSISGKLTALANLLRTLRERTEEKCIIVSHYTSTLNIIEAFCKANSYTYLRLDGQTPASKRQEYVNAFNKSSQQHYFLFLLSSKAGGVGLNLVGASRLCLIDSDWNPSHDLQSMARIHRDGQKRPVFIYRFVTAGTIDGEEESPLLSGFVAATQISKTYLNQMDKVDLRKKRAELATLGEWTHINCLHRVSRNEMQDEILWHLLHSAARAEVVVEGEGEGESRLDRLPTAGELDNIIAVDDVGPPLALCDVPGGTVSFLFERITASTCDKENGLLDDPPL
ncbi:hypothetical protein ID866_8566 [Astraeus odoratus]|nr:hypothetical protein ID866_8566 [Astraeus odoratus]